MPRVAAIVLAAGRARRMQGANKLLAMLGGMPLIARVVDNTLAANARPVVVVTGHQADGVRSALAGRNDLTFVHNADFDRGLAGSLRAGIAAVEGRCDGALVCLGDMPRVSAHHLGLLMAAFEASAGHDVCAPFHGERRGNPVLWPARCFTSLRALAGDTGGRALLELEGPRLRRVAVDDDGVLADVDTQAALDVLARDFE